MEMVHGIFLMNLPKMLRFMVLTIAHRDILKTK